MWNLLPSAAGRSCLLLVNAVAEVFRPRRSWAGKLVLLLGTPVFIMWQLLTWLGFALDEVLFSGYRAVEVRAPLFIVGPPRSGTTFLHRALSGDVRYTTFKTWECILGLSVTGRYLCLGVARLDRALGRPLARVANWVGRRFTGGMDSIHALELNAAEEDFLCLLPANACFLQVFPYPLADWLWREARLDIAVPADRQQALMQYYRACVQKHLYVFGRDKVYLSKNPTFSGATQSLLRAFPDARVLACMRHPEHTVPSQLSSLRPFLRGCGFTTLAPQLRDRLVALLRHYYLHLADVADEHPDRVVFVDNARLRSAPAATVQQAFAALGLDCDAALQARLAAKAMVQQSAQHDYTLEEFGLSRQALHQSFGSVLKRFEFAPAGNA